MKCDGCTLCCELLDVPWMNSPAGEICKKCKKGIGCTIYNDAPKDCLDFKCAYNQMEKVSLDLRPDKCGVIFERVTDTIFIGTVDPKREKPNQVVINQISAFLDDGFSVILFNKKIKEPIIINAKGKTKQEIWLEFKKLEKKYKCQYRVTQQT